MKIVKFTCPQCGAPLKKSAGIIECNYCGGTFIIEDNDGMSVKYDQWNENRSRKYNPHSDYFMNDHNCKRSKNGVAISGGEYFFYTYDK